MNRRSALLALAAASVPWLALPARAASLEGVSFDDRVRLGGADLQLNGIGLRAAGWFKAYVAGLYVERPSQEPAALVTQEGPKRIRLVMMAEAPSHEFVKALEKGIRRNVSAEEEPRLAERLARFSAQIDALQKVRPGDAVDLDFIPARGLQLLMNGRPRGEPIPGADFYAALLRSFIGERPYHKTLKAGMLGLKP